MDRRVFLAMTLAVLSTSASAGYYDGKQQLLCTTFQTFQCDPSAGCESVAIDDVGGSRQYLLDFKKKEVTDGSEVRSRIDNYEVIDRTLFVQGVEDGRSDVRDGVAWSLSVSDPDGMMVLSVSAGDVGFVGLGACTPYDGK